MSASSLIEDVLYDLEPSYGIWGASLVEYIHTMMFACIMMALLYRRMPPENCPSSVWLSLVRLIDSVLFSMSNLPGISRILYILTIRMSAPYIAQVLVTYTAYTATIAFIVSLEILNRSNAIQYMACQTAASVYILIKLAIVFGRTLRRPRNS